MVRGYLYEVCGAIGAYDEDVVVYGEVFAISAADIETDGAG